VKTVRLGSQTVQNVVIYTAIIEVENRDLALKPGMTATLRIFTERKENILRISNAALRWRPPGEQPPPAAAVQPAQPNPFSVAPAGGPPGQPGGQNAQRQMLERFAVELKLDEAQKKQLDGFAREARQAAAAEGPVETPEARRERGRKVAAAIGERLKPILRADQLPLYEMWIAERAAQRAGSAGVPGRIYLLDADGKPALAQVRLGATDGTNTEIVSGAQEGQKAVIGGGAKAKSGGAGPPRIF
jgi:HlyD family secretion protein